MRLAILGCGPSGLIAAQTAREHGASVQVFSKGATPSYIAGTQYLHSRVPGVNDRQPDGYIFIQKKGTRDDYATKVYGSHKAPVSWDKYEEKEYAAWDMRGLYERLWFSWGGLVTPATLNSDHLRDMMGHGILGSQKFDAAVSTVPLRAICQYHSADGIPPVLYDKPIVHSFAEQKVHILQQENRQAAHPYEYENYIIYNGEENPSWYRMSYLFGSVAYEWSATMKKPPVEGIVTINKPLFTNCDCYENTEFPFIKVGRYGSWRKDALVHDVVSIVEGLVNA